METIHGEDLLLGENLQAVVESPTWFTMELQFCGNQLIGGKPMLCENLRAVVESRRGL